MFIYILNILNDGFKRAAHGNNLFPLEIIKDTNYISELGGINKNVDFYIIRDRLVSIIDIFCKYNLTLTEIIIAMKRLLDNKGNNWVLENFYNCEFNIKIDNSCLILNSAINEILWKSKVGDYEMTINDLAL